MLIELLSNPGVESFKGNILNLETWAFILSLSKYLLNTMLDRMRDMETLYQIVVPRRLQSRRAGVDVGKAHKYLQYETEYDKCKERVTFGRSIFTGRRAHIWLREESGRLWGGGGFWAECMREVKLVGKHKTRSGNSQQSSLDGAQSTC